MSGTPKHGLSRTAEYRCWQTMRLRCHEPSNPAYKDYGARGITVCERWMHSPENFLADMGVKPSPRHELDRIDNSKGYSPENCRWVTRDLNSRNRRSNRWVEFKGERKTLIEWSVCSGVSADTITKRLDAGWSPEQAIDHPDALQVTQRAAKAEARTVRYLREACDEIQMSDVLEQKSNHGACRMK